MAVSDGKQSIKDILALFNAADKDTRKDFVKLIELAFDATNNMGPDSITPNALLLVLNEVYIKPN